MSKKREKAFSVEAEFPGTDAPKEILEQWLFKVATQGMDAEQRALAEAIDLARWESDEERRISPESWAETRDLRDLEQQALFAATQGLSDDDLPATWMADLRFALRLGFYRRALAMGARQARARSTSAAGTASKAVKQDAKAERNARWNAQAEAMIRARPSISKEEIVDAIAAVDSDVRAGTVGANAILRAVSVEEIRGRIEREKRASRSS